MEAYFGLFLASVFVLYVFASPVLGTGSSTAPTVTPLSEITGAQFSVGPFLKVIPVRVRSNKGDPLLAFYMINSSLQPKIEVLMDSEITTSFDFSIICINRNISMLLKVSAYHEDNLQVNGQRLFPISCEDAVEKNLRDVYSTPSPLTGNTTIPDWKIFVAQGQVNVKLRSGIIGQGTVEFSLLTVSKDPKHQKSYSDIDDLVSKNETNATFVIVDPVQSGNTLTYKINVIRKVRLVDRLFRVAIYGVQIFTATGFGCKLDLGVVKENLWRPVAPGIGLACQYILMPLIAFAIAKAVRIDIAAVSLGIFVAGCCPGGGASNMYSYLLKGDLSLSITMTALSTVLALAMLPLWIYTLGTTFSEAGGLSIPFEMVAVSLSILITPLVVGLFLRQKFPKVADKIQRVLKPVTVIMIIILLAVGVYSNLYIFRLFKPNVILAGCLLPYIGYVSGGLVATIFRQPWKCIKTIILETGMQNTSIAYILLINSFPAPTGDIAAVAPVASAVMTPLPPFIITIFYLLYHKFCNKNKGEEDEEKANKNGTTVQDEADVKLTSETQTEADDKSFPSEKVALATV
ncbi:ileal sodium/bile acid cotransporter-like [Mercenaria mercenaria]|uniref:ileal sodium/bile acid cotransporter-like n=1 Tax=Mercenaria mercenaria TaxID=6596 RepID=UPI00234F058B|nr:ileal sodium/bile acid cotransporter-like [Mercenaria mercenaria]